MSDYKDKIDGMIWSHSRVSSYVQCPYSFYLRYIINDDEQYLSEGNYYAEVGLYVHSILEKIYKGELEYDDALQYFIDNFEDNVFYETRQSIMDKTYMACLEYFSEVDLDITEEAEILGVELEIKTTVDGYDFTGYIDLLLRNKNSGDIFIIDHKSSSYPFKQDGITVRKKEQDNFMKYKHQMYLYCKYVHDAYGGYPKWIVWNHFKDKKFAKIPFDENEYHEALDWYISQIHNIENDNEFEANCEYFYCTQLCNFRASCEYKTME